MHIKEILSSTTCGNIIGIISLLIGAASLAWTGFTYRTAKRIERKLPEEQAKAINSMRFKEYRTEAIKSLKSRQDVVKDAGEISRQTCDELIMTCGKIKGYCNDLFTEDLTRVEDLYDRSKCLLQNGQYKCDQGTIDYIEISNDLIKILEDGKYDT